MDSKPTGEVLTKLQAKFPSLYQDSNGTALSSDDYPTFGEIYLSELEGKLSTFQTATERKTEVPDEYDFPVLVLDDTNRYATTELLNNYIRVLTNTTYNYNEAGTSYTVRFGKCTYNTTGDNAGKFSVNWANNVANLRITTDSFFQIYNGYDNENTDGQFTLVDVQFKIPANINGTTNYIAYHLYIPVLVKKMLKFDFEVTALSGTTYRLQPYEALRNNVLIENLETPVTLQFRWVYRRSFEDWVGQIAGGESLLQTFSNKRLNVSESNRAVSNVSELGFPDANMILIDGNNLNKPYYATKSMAYSSTSGNGTLDLTHFTTTGTNFGTAFSPTNFLNYFDITVSETETTGDDVIECVKLSNSTGATVKVGNDYYRAKEDSESGTSYYLTFAFKDGMYATGSSGEDYLKEDYYITFYTKKATLANDAPDTSIYHLVFSSPQNFGSSVMPNDINNSGTADMFLGDIFSNTFSMLGIYPTSYELNTISTSIGATFQSELKLTNTSKSIVKSYLGNPSVSIYQSFLIDFNKSFVKNGALTNEQGVKSEPNVTVTSYVIDTENASGKGVPKVGDNDGGVDVTSDVSSDPVCEISVDNGTITSNFIELRNNQDLKEYLKLADDGIKIKAAFTLNYTGSDEAETKLKITEQFPLRDVQAILPENVTLSQIGTKILGSSNISPSNVSTAYSKTLDDGEGTTMYYTGLRSGVIMHYDSDDSANIDGRYAQLGINSWNSSDTELSMKTLITYNVKNIEKAGTENRMELTLKLYRKGSYETNGQELPIAEYIDVRDTVDGQPNTAKLIVKDKDGNAVTINTTDPKSYVCSISDPKNSLIYDADSMVYNIPIDFSVFTGDNEGFEQAKNNNETYKYYSNYMVKAEIKLYNTEGEIPGSDAGDHVIYSNAKIYTDWIDNS